MKIRRQVKWDCFYLFVYLVVAVGLKKDETISIGLKIQLKDGCNLVLNIVLKIETLPCINVLSTSNELATHSS